MPLTPRYIFEYINSRTAFIYVLNYDLYPEKGIEIPCAQFYRVSYQINDDGISVFSPYIFLPDKLIHEFFKAMKEIYYENILSEVPLIDKTVSVSLLSEDKIVVHKNYRRRCSFLSKHITYYSDDSFRIIDDRILDFMFSETFGTETRYYYGPGTAKIWVEIDYGVFMSPSEIKQLECKVDDQVLIDFSNFIKDYRSINFISQLIELVCRITPSSDESLQFVRYVHNSELKFVLVYNNHKIIGYYQKCKGVLIKVRYCDHKFTASESTLGELLK